MRLTARQLNRATLARQLLLRRESLPLVSTASARGLASAAQAAAAKAGAIASALNGLPGGLPVQATCRTRERPAHPYLSWVA